MTPADFFRSHGLVVDDPRNDNRWHRVPTTDKPKRKNGAYRWDGEVAFCQNWSEPSSQCHSWKDDTVRVITDADRREAQAKRAAVAETQERGWARAAAEAAKILASCRPGNHGYPQRKGFGTTNVLVTPEGAMFVPMRRLDDNSLVGGQVIKWLQDERVWQKRFVPGMRAKGAVFRLGHLQATETIICEGWATGMSIAAAVSELRLKMAVLVAFSAGNIVNVAPLAKGKAFVFADHDESRAGEEAAVKTGLPWTMSDTVGEDANDLATRLGLRALAGKVMDLRRQRSTPVDMAR